MFDSLRGLEYINLLWAKVRVIKLYEIFLAQLSTKIKM